jgi:tRNA dimethylallyltransferase
MQNILLVLLGPTGVGKTDFSIAIAEMLRCEIISCDSRQFYREMSIGTAIPDVAHLKKVKHHFIKFISVKDYYSSSLFERDVVNLLPSLFKANNVVLMSGGSGLYIDSVCEGIDDIPDVDPEIREKYTKKYFDEGLESLQSSLKLLDPEHYKNVDLKNYKRVIRALEICESTGQPYSTFLKKEKRERDFKIIKIGLKRPREELYDRINKRVDSMVIQGLEDEARSLYEYKNLNALNTVGYKEFFEFFEGKITKEKAVELIKRNSRRYAKRQMTWWAKDMDIKWFNPEKNKEIFEYIEEVVGG